MAHTDFNIDKVTNLKIKNKEGQLIANWPCESLYVTQSYDNPIKLDFKAVLNGEKSITDTIKYTTTNMVDSIIDEIDKRLTKIETKLDITEINDACEAISKASKRMGCSEKEAGQALKIMSERLKTYKNEEDDIFLNSLKIIADETEAMTIGIYGK